MKDKSFKLSRIILLAVAVLLFVPKTNYAQEHGSDRNNHHDRQVKHNVNHHDRRALDHGKRDRAVARHNDDYREVVVKDRHFFYRGGAFYERGPNGYVIATAPIGARIDVLPGGYTVIRHHGLRYFLFGGIYYKFLPHERAYVVVSAPF
jgi:hypothetical protein